MDNHVSLFSFGEKSIRTLLDEDNIIWFVAKDICDSLGYANHKKAISDHVDGEDIKGVTIRDPLGKNPQKANAVNESGMYSLVLRSRKKEAKPFKRWVTSEVLPSIRKTGKYEAPYSVNPTDSLTKEQADELRGLITSTAEKLPKSERASFTIKAWSKLKAHFGVKYRDIPQQHYVDALSIVSRHVAEVIAQPIPKQSMFHGLQDGCYHASISEGKTTIADINAIEGELLPREETPRLPDHIAQIPFDLSKDEEYRVYVSNGKARRQVVMTCSVYGDDKQSWWLEA